MSLGLVSPPAAVHDLAFRAGEPRDAAAIVHLIEANRAEGHLLPRQESEVSNRAHRFVLIVHEDAVVGCAELAPLSRAVAEVRSLVVHAAWRGRGLGGRLVDTLRRRARLEGFSTLCAFTHEPSHFVRLGFSIAPHVWFPEKIATDCHGCPLFRACGQHAVVLALAAARPLAPIPGGQPPPPANRRPAAAAPRRSASTVVQPEAIAG